MVEWYNQQHPLTGSVSFGVAALNCEAAFIFCKVITPQAERGGSLF